MNTATVERSSSNWIQTYSGRQFWPLDAAAADVDIEDIAHALSNICRYTGHCLKFYSVAQHSVLVSHVVPAEHAKWGLLHDATEAYICDLARPIKYALPEYKAIEERLERIVAERFELALPMPASIKQADLMMLATERRDLMSPPPIPWVSTENVAPVTERIRPWQPFEARRNFLRRYHELFGISRKGEYAPGGGW